MLYSQMGLHTKRNYDVLHTLFWYNCQTEWISDLIILVLVRLFPTIPLLGRRLILDVHTSWEQLYLCTLYCLYRTIYQLLLLTCFIKYTWYCSWGFQNWVILWRSYALSVSTSYNYHTNAGIDEDCTFSVLCFAGSVQKTPKNQRVILSFFLCVYTYIRRKMG